MTNIDSIRPLITPATILMISGIILERISSIEVVSQLGEVLARGAFLSFIMVITLLPALLILLDKVIRFTTLRRKHEKDN